MRSIFRLAGCLSGPILIGLAFLIPMFFEDTVVPILEIKISWILLGFGALVIVSQILSLAYRFTID